MSTHWQRARRPEQKEERSEAILNAAARLIDKDGLEGTGLNAIARAAGISKGAMYRYFESREAVLMQLLIVEHRDCMAALEKGFKPLAGSGDARAVAQAIADTIGDRPRYWLLLGALAGILEHNVTVETVTQFKRDLNAAIAPTHQALQAAIPRLSSETLFEYMAFLTMAAGGVWPHTRPSPVAREVLENPEFAHFKIDFKKTMQTHAQALLEGLMYRKP